MVFIQWCESTKFSVVWCWKGGLLIFIGFLSLKNGVGVGSNTKAKLLSLWMVLLFGRRINLKHLQIVEDSKVVAEWFNGTGKLQVISLEA